MPCLTAASTRAESAEKQLESGDRGERETSPRNNTVRLELRGPKLSETPTTPARLRREQCKLQDQRAGPDETGRIRELQEEKAKLQQRLADLQTYFIMRVGRSTA